MDQGGLTTKRCKKDILSEIRDYTNIQLMCIMENE